ACAASSIASGPDVDTYAGARRSVGSWRTTSRASSGAAEVTALLALALQLVDVIGLGLGRSELLELQHRRPQLCVEQGRGGRADITGVKAAGQVQRAGGHRGLCEPRSPPVQVGANGGLHRTEVTHRV